ncbi:Gfo/Idh/MocA family oxidoreductase [Flavicella sp.]|uniref:Gfo/Idh/MocA family protein n=1 Tax=Flavicella sp. TaxID=2957742 RepID=UPI0026022AEA|nr:Gfo/Idh/MocA family oxidoreductase [Flavicella sp.]MDG1803852.1 Gfo/Idh/MocA family oxidoreductase [Flavicella sp.]MDG2280958.1 Gfo/Idh/MocA family oxidoreductase [Flavicella sp.]
MKEYKWGIIGCGDVTEKKSGPAYQQTDNFRLHAVMRRDLKKAKDYAQRHAVPFFYSNADELIQNPEIDAVYIATPPDTHKYYALKVAAAGKPCCIEKPMAPSYEDCIEITDTFQRLSIPLYVAYYRRSLPRFLKIKEWLDSNEIGEVRHVNYLYTRTASPLDLSDSYNWRTDKEIAYGGYFDDLASHALDLFMFLLGDIENASGMSTNQQNIYSAMDAVVGYWKHSNGVTGSGSWNFGANERNDRVEILGNKGVIRFSVFNEEEISIESAEKKDTLFIENPDPIQLHHVKNIQQDLIYGLKHPSTGASATKTTWVMDKILSKEI